MRPEESMTPGQAECIHYEEKRMGTDSMQVLRRSTAVLEIERKA